MDINLIERLAAVFKDAKLTKMELTEGDFSLKFERGGFDVQPAARPVSETPESVGTEPPQAEIKPEDGKAATSEEAGKQIKSPLAGIFYSSATPDGEPYVRVGDTVNRGDVLCIIEAMKVMNEITADGDGEIIEICAQNEDIVEYGQVLFRIK